MDNSYTVINRFTPPTCTLEIWGKNSPLSRWSNKTILKDVRFKLSFDDPKILESDPVVIKGDREELDTLYNSVLGYTDNFLTQSFVPGYQSLKNPSSTSRETDLSPDSQIISITPQNLVTHQLTWSGLGGEKAIAPINLSATQLFDLVSALEDYQKEMSVLAELTAQKQQKPNKFIPLGLSAAGIVLAVGLANFGLQMANQKSVDDSVAVNSQLEVPAVNTTQTPEVIAPEVPDVVVEPEPNLTETETLGSSETLPPPPSVTTPKPPPDIPDPALYPPSGNLKIPPLTSLPKLEQPLGSSKPENPLKTGQVESKIAVTPQPVLESAITEQTNKNEDTSDSDMGSNDAKEEITVATDEIPLDGDDTQEQTAIVLEETPEVAAPDITQKFGRDRAAFSDAEIAILNRTASPSSETISPNASPAREPETRIAAGNQIEKPSLNPATSNQSNSKIPSISQQAEIKTYFQQKWQPPNELNRNLEYRLQIAQDGSLKRVIPLGKAASIYLDRTGIPLLGESFVSPLNEKDSATVRLVLSPDGEVRTFLE